MSRFATVTLAAFVTLTLGAPPAADARQAATPTAAASADARSAAVGEFRAAYSDGRIADALAPARRVVELTQQTAPDSAELGVAYNNLATVQLRLRQFADAADSFRSAVATSEAAEGRDAASLVAPLGGLGIALAAQDRHADAITVIDRALAIHGKAPNAAPADALGLLEQLAASHAALGNVEQVDSTRAAALALAEQSYGPGDFRLIPTLQRLATWQEQVGRFGPARETHRRALAIAESAGPSGKMHAVLALRGIARSYRGSHAQSAGGADETRVDGGTALARANVPRMPGGMVTAGMRDYQTTAPGIMLDSGRKRLRPPPDPQGTQAIERALQLIDAPPQSSLALRAATLIDAGDWYTSAGDYSRALPLWSSAAALLSAGDAAGDPLAKPRLLAYRPTEAELRNAQERTAQSSVITGEFSFKVTATGEVTDVTVVRSDLSPQQEFAVRTALKDALYAPRLVGGRAVDTDSVTFTSTWFGSPR